MRENAIENRGTQFDALVGRKLEGARIDLEDPNLTVHANAAAELAVLQPEAGEPHSREPFMQLLEAA